MHRRDPIERALIVAKSKSDLHRAIDMLPDDAKLLVIANACCCGNSDHVEQGEAIYTAAFGEPSLVEALGLVRLAEHRLVGEAFAGT
ncbi:MAG TPA: hypothetical protein VHT05_10120 [Candidatus Elarobacter sp.]|jgi:hypothetical protein|nr:hypothetical protein [Candidatus Elarobacter sp.]